MNKIDSNNLKKRYLIWFYKLTKEALDKIDRKFTQLEVDRLVYKMLKSELRKSLKEPRLKEMLIDFEEYIAKKEKDAINLKFAKPGSEKLSCEYAFTKAKLDSIEHAIIKLLGKSELKKIKNLYEQEMARRILASTGH